MDGSRFDDLARSLAGPKSRRGFVGGLLALGAGLAGIAPAGAACPPGQVSVRGRCVCKRTGRPPVQGICPCPNGQVDNGDGLGCIGCRAASDCPTSKNPCVSYECVKGACRQSSLSCDDGDACTRDTCDPAGGCVHTPVACDDGRGVCTDKACDPAAGCVFTPISCDDGNPCTVDSCDPAEGCVHTPASDGLVCPGGFCRGGSCQPECLDDVQCDDGNACTVDTCDPGLGCRHTPITCDDDFDACTTNSCDPAIGCVSTPVDCDDGNPCTIDTCDPDTGCVHTDVPEGDVGGCPPGTFCFSGSCAPGEPSDCAGRPEGSSCGLGRVCLDGLCQGNGACSQAGAPGCSSSVLCDDFSAPGTPNGCLETVEEAVICIQVGVCSAASACSSSADCPTGYVCVNTFACGQQCRWVCPI